MATNIEMNVKQESDYEVIYPQTIQALVIDLLNSDTKQLLGLEETATADEAFREIYLNQVLSGKALINFTVVGDDGSPCYGVEIASDSFCDANGNKVDKVETNQQGKASIFANATSVACKIQQYGDVQNWNQTYSVTFGEQYDKEITLTRRNFLMVSSARNIKFSKDVKQLDVTVVGGGGSGGGCARGYRNNDREGSASSGGGGGGGYCVFEENYSFIPNQIYNITIGTGGAIPKWNEDGNDGGKSSFNDLTANGGTGGKAPVDNVTAGVCGIGNGNGGTGVIVDYGNKHTISSGRSGANGTVQGYINFDSKVYFGGGGASGSAVNGKDKESTIPGGKDYGGYGGKAWFDYVPSGSNMNGGNGKYGGGGGSGGVGAYNNSASETGESGLPGAGGKGVVTFRMVI